VIGHQRISQIVTDADSNQQEYYFTFDGHGSTRVLLDAALAVAQIYSFDAYGNALGFNVNEALTEFLYSGEQFDSKIGQQYLRQRYYDPSTGRFNRLDPFFGNLNDPQSLHKYLYAHDDPIINIDPPGLYPSFISLVSRTILGIYVHKHIGDEFKHGHDYRWANQPIKKILNKLNIKSTVPIIPLRPDLAECDNQKNGSVYELKPGEFLTFNTPAFAISAWEAIPQLTNYYITLEFYTFFNLPLEDRPSQGKTWQFGRNYANGLNVWKGYTRGIIPGWTLITYADYALVPGVLEYDFVPTKYAQVAELMADSLVAVAYLQQMGLLEKAFGSFGRWVGIAQSEKNIRLQFATVAAPICVIPLISW
jgi:RHS repeat-associated protein